MYAFARLRPQLLREYYEIARDLIIFGSCRIPGESALRVQPQVAVAMQEMLGGIPGLTI